MQQMLLAARLESFIAPAFRSRSSTQKVAQKNKRPLPNSPQTRIETYQHNWILSEKRV